VRRLTLKELEEQYGGDLPPDAVLRPDEDETPPPRAATVAKPKKRRGRTGRFAVLNAFADYGMAGVTGAEAKVWFILFRDTKANGLARTGQGDIARRAGFGSTRTVRRALESLERKGMVRIVRRGRLGTGPSVYRLHPTGDA